MLRAASPLPVPPPSSPFSAPPSPTPPPSPSGPSAVFARPPFHPHLRQPVFDLQSSSPVSFDGAEKTRLKAQLDRARANKAVFRDGEPARALTAKERERLKREEAEDGETSTASDETKVGALSGCEEASDWVTDDEAKGARGAHPLSPLAAAGEASRRADERPISSGQAEEISLPRALPRQRSSSNNAAPLLPGSTTTPRASRTAPPTPSISPTSRLSVLLARPTAKVPPSTALSSPSPVSFADPWGTRQTTSPALTWNDQPLAAALAAENAPTPRPARPQSTYPFPSDGLAATKPLERSKPKKPLGKARSLPAPPPNSPAGSASSRSMSSFRTGSSASPPPPPVPRLPPSSSFPAAQPNRFLSASRLSSPNASPPLPPLRGSPIMSAKDPKDLTLHFARRPDMPRKASLGGEGYERTRTALGLGLRRHGSTSSDGKRRVASGMMRGSDADVELTDTEVEGSDQEVLYPLATTTGSAASSVQSSPKLTSASLSDAFSLPSPVLARAPPLPPPVMQVAHPHRPPVAAPPSASNVPPKHVDLRQFRQQQQARRMQMQVEAGDGASSSSSSPAPSDDDRAPPLRVASPSKPRREDVRGEVMPPSRPSASPPQPRWATVFAGSRAETSVVTSKAGEQVIFRTSDSAQVPAGRGGGAKRFFSRS
ncbi:hypothetical protein JCM10213v2_001355 [Rhodosporidiobolus nylandii]